MTEVTKSTYTSLLPEVFAAIREADFVAIDTNAESTGFLLHNESVNIRELKGPEWYDIIRKNQTTRSPMDFGIAVFKQIHDPDPVPLSTSTTKKFQMKCYNMPILFAYVEEHDARQEVRDARYTEERLDIDSIGFEFLQRINFDLNKMLYDGTPFMNKERQEEAKDYMEKHPGFMTISGKHVTNGDLEVAYFPKVVEKLTPKDIQEIISRLRGIAEFFDITAETKIPVVGHNLLVKLTLLYKDFVEYLPLEFPEFLEKLEKVMPQFYDTKFIANEIATREGLSDTKKNIVQNTNLYELFRNTDWVGQFNFSFCFDESSVVYEQDLEDLKTEKIEDDITSFCYESGFDACISGIVLAKLAILACNDFGIDVLTKQRQWRNRMFVQKELQSQSQDSPSSTKTDSNNEVQNMCSALASSKIKL